MVEEHWTGSRRSESRSGPSVTSRGLVNGEVAERKGGEQHGLGRQTNQSECLAPQFTWANY